VEEEGSDVTRRPVLLGLALLFAAFAAYGSLVPLELRGIPISEAVEVFLSTPLVPIGQASRTDFVTNFLLFVPIGFFLLGALAPRKKGLATLAALPVIVVSIAISVATEFGQVFVVGRTPSWNDVVAQSLGACAGAAFWLVAGDRLVGWFEPVLHSARPTDRVFRVLAAYTVLWLLMGVVPFDYTLRPQEIAEKFRAGRIVLQPFGPRTSLADVLSTLLMVIPVGVFCAMAASRFRFEATRLVALVGGLLAVLAVESVQLLAVSRTADATDVLVAAIGIGIGVQLGSRPGGAPEPGEFRLWPLAALILWLGVVLARHWAPFDFVADGRFVRGRLPMLFQVPFSSYYWGHPLNAFSEVVTKVLLAVPVGALLQLIWMPRSPRGRALQLLAIGLLSAAIFVTVEAGQLMLRTRIPDQTDVYIGVGGALLGVALIRLVSRAHEGSRSTLRAGN